MIRLRTDDQPEPVIVEPEEDGAIWSLLAKEFKIDPILAAEISDWFEERKPGLGKINGHIRQFGVIKTLEYLWRKRRPSRLVTFALCYAPGIAAMDDIVDHMNMSQFARKSGVSKEAVRKEVHSAQHWFGLPPRPDQRNGYSRHLMSAARRKQLK